MSTPAQPVLTVTADKDTYDVGDPIVVTMVLSGNGTSTPVTLTINGTVTDTNGNTFNGETSVTVNQDTPVPVQSAQVSDSLSDAFTQQSLDGDTAIFAGTVGTPPAA